MGKVSALKKFYKLIYIGETNGGLENTTTEPQESKQESNSLMDELERLRNMYEKGLLTDEEFSIA